GHEGATAENGPWAFTLDMPSYLPLMQHCRNRSLREEVYRAFVTRASEGDIDNTPVITRILQLKQEKAKLLGFKSHAEVPMQWRMATIESAHKLVEDLRDAAFDISVKEHEELKAFAKEQGAEEADDLRQWDVTFWGERLREARYELTQEELRPYFSFPVVIDGLFKLASRLFDVSFQPADGEAPTWNPDVRYYKVTDSSGNTVASFLLDPYSRPAEKRSGAWMDGICNRSGLFAAPGAAARLPVTHIVCNQTPPLGDKPSLMTFNEVETLFHEFGHALQHMLTRQQEGLVAGISNVEWDAVELPSQFMENWCYHRCVCAATTVSAPLLVCHLLISSHPAILLQVKCTHYRNPPYNPSPSAPTRATLLGIARHYETGEVLPEELATLLGIAKHYETGEVLPEELYNKIVAAKNFRSATMTMRQLHFAAVDLELHCSFDPEGNESIYDVNSRVAERMLVLPPLPSDRFLCSFLHIFAGGYDVGYYSYKWAEVLSADAFAAFEEAGLDDDEAVKATGHKFRDTVLALGGGAAAKDLLKSFLLWLKNDVGVWGPVIMALAYIPLNILALPGAILTLGGGYVFGLLVGFVADSLGSTAGATAAFLVGKTIGRSYVSAKLKEYPQFQPVAHAISKSGFKIVLLLRLVPILPFNVMNYVLSVTPISLSSYVLASWIGMMPITFTFVYLGTTIKDISEIGSPGAAGASQWVSSLMAVAVLVGGMVLMGGQCFWGFGAYEGVVLMGGRCFWGGGAYEGVVLMR
ncbi:unnamed protein product, partial [Closterium sp. Naga37s-1]